MKAPTQIPDSVRERQVAASDPDASVFVAANAGSGKTHVLAQRVIRLLLKGVPPARILCITFTKAAAANMANRVFDTLARWTSLDERALDAAMKLVGVGPIDDNVRARARRLFALALETPGGLKVQTIHAFCTHLLHVFPFEAKVAARFEVLDEAAEMQLLEQINFSVLLEAAARPESTLGRALTAAIAVAADQTLRDMLAEAVAARDKLEAWVQAAGGLGGAIGQLSAAFGVGTGDSVEAVDAAVMASSLIPATEWAAIAEALAQGSKTDGERSRLFALLSACDGDERREVYLDIFCTKDRQPRKNPFTKEIQRVYPELFKLLLAEQERICVLLDRRRALRVRDRTAALITLAVEIIDRYRKEKERRALLDYEDLIDKALAMLTDTSPAWVHYKLDRGIDHVLIDEAQDTSPKQWAIVQALVKEFFAGKGAHEQPRTIFAVGDEKQSIFSFQGAAPREFEEMRREFDRLSRAIDRELVRVNFDHSFRSGANVLAAVDIVFKTNEIYRSIVWAEDGYLDHAALPDAAPGLVEIWPTFTPDAKRAIEAWDAPFDDPNERSPIARLAKRIAGTVRVWNRQGTRPGEVLVLVRRRGALFEAIIRALKDAGIAVAGADRLVLTEHIAVMDLLVLADALLLPDDDLALATVLKSPLFGFDEDQLFKLACNRRGRLRTALAAKAAGDAHFKETASALDRMADDARRLPPFEFYARLLNADHARQRILARLGAEAADALDEFLNLALEYERSETPSLQGFVAWARAAQANVKRDMEIARDEVRVMTVHGAKGLEARNVILADTTTPPEGWYPPKLLALSPAGAGPDAPDMLLWSGPKRDDIGPMDAARARAQAAMQDEYRRLLYVAMTRAAERLVICGAEGQRGRPPGCWYNLISDALIKDAAEEDADDGEGKVWRYRKVQAEGRGQVSPKDDQPDPTALPDWLTQDAPPEEPRVIIRPSDAEEGNIVVRAGSREARSKARERGNIVHRLMQSLPDIPLERRAAAAREYLARRAKLFSEAERETIATGVFSVLGDPGFAAMFAPGSRAEVPIVGRVGGTMVAGQVDRLVVTPDAVFIADYKTNASFPSTPAEALKRHGSYVRQLALYRAVLEKLYPGRIVRAALVWTEGPQLMEIPAESLESALATFVAA
jgi:ATP-dependent helicase/nuclease subunit A